VAPQLTPCVHTVDTVLVEIARCPRGAHTYHCRPRREALSAAHMIVPSSCPSVRCVTLPSPQSLAPLCPPTFSQMAGEGHEKTRAKHTPRSSQPSRLPLTSSTLALSAHVSAHGIHLPLHAVFERRLPGSLSLPRQRSSRLRMSSRRLLTSARQMLFIPLSESLNVILYIQARSWMRVLWIGKRCLHLTDRFFEFVVSAFNCYLSANASASAFRVRSST
jgi:hypothetical protein